MSDIWDPILRRRILSSFLCRLVWGSCYFRFWAEGLGCRKRCPFCWSVGDTLGDMVRSVRRMVFYFDSANYERAGLLLLILNCRCLKSNYKVIEVKSKLNE